MLRVVDSDSASPGGKLAGDPRVDVPGPQVAQLDPAERRQQVVVHVLEVVGDGGRMKYVQEVDGEDAFGLRAEELLPGRHGAACGGVDSEGLRMFHAVEAAMA